MFSIFRKYKLKKNKLTGKTELTGQRDHGVNHLYVENTETIFLISRFLILHRLFLKDILTIFTFNFSRSSRRRSSRERSPRYRDHCRSSRDGKLKGNRDRYEKKKLLDYPEIGGIYDGCVNSIVPYGAFVEVIF